MYLSVKEAAELTGKSATTIYRLCNKRINTEYVKKEDNKFLINREFLLATYPPEQKVDNKTSVKVDQPVIKEPEKVIEIDTTEEQKEPVLDIQRSDKNLAEDIVEEKTEEIEAGTTIEFTNKKAESFYLNLAKPDVIIGVLASVIIISLFIFLLSLSAN